MFDKIGNNLMKAFSFCLSNFLKFNPTLSLCRVMMIHRIRSSYASVSRMHFLQPNLGRQPCAGGGKQVRGNLGVTGRGMINCLEHFNLWDSCYLPRAR